MFVRCWRKLSGFIADLRKDSEEPISLEAGAWKRKHFEQFAYKAEGYLERTGYRNGS